MELNKELNKNEVQQVSSDNQENNDIEFGVDDEDKWIIFKSFTNYSDPHGSIVREIASNAWDAHKEAGIKKNIDVEITEENDLTGSASTISFRDYGNGMSPDIIKNIYSKFGKSTKRQDNTQIGAFGLR